MINACGGSGEGEHGPETQLVRSYLLVYGCPLRCPRIPVLWLEEIGMSMETNLQGRLRNTSLPYNQGLLPLFEAVINSIHSIEETGVY